MGTFTVNGRAAAAGINKVDAALRNILRKTAERSPYNVEVFSGKRSGKGKSRHDTGKAVDVVLRDPRTGQAIPNLGSKPGFDAYQGFANAARDVQQQDYPNLSNQFRWGGYFSPSGLNPKGFDLMHFDLKPGASMAFGTWDGGLNADGQAAFAKLGSGMIYSADGRVVAPKGAQYANLWGDPQFAASRSLVPPGSIPDVSLSGTYGTLRLKKSPKVDERVRFLQETLNDQFGFDLEPDGRFGPATDAAVRAMQKTMGIEADGVVGPNTWGAIQTVTRPDMSLEARDARALARATPGVTGNAISTRSQQPAAMTAQPQRPSPFDALSGVSTRPSPRPPEPMEALRQRAMAARERTNQMAAGIDARAERERAFQTRDMDGSYRAPAATASPAAAKVRPSLVSPDVRERAVAARDQTAELARRMDASAERERAFAIRDADPGPRADLANLERLLREKAANTSTGTGSLGIPPSFAAPMSNFAPEARPSPPSVAAAASVRPSPVGETVSPDTGLWSGRHRMAPGAKAALSAGVGLMTGGPLGALVAGSGALIKNSMNKRTEIEDLQRTLRDNGFDPGPIDGIMGPRTQRAISTARSGLSPSSGTRAVTAPLPRPRPAVATRPSPAPRQPTREEAFATRDADAFAGLSRPSLVRPASAPIPRPNPTAPGQGAVASARRTASASRPSPRDSGGGTTRTASGLDRVKAAFRTQDASRSMRDRVRASRL